jgi:fido (protein-threonine AMPylation protein)
MDTELKLLHWRDGQTKAERLCANLLDLDGFSSIDPQCPLGGPDGLKDIVCEKNGWKYIGAAYFPTTPQNFESIQSKFEHDIAGVAKNKADGLAFLTNQKLTPKERETLVDLAVNKNCKAIVYHIERIRVLLDSPLGFALRLEYLGVEMSSEEQLSFFSQQRNYLRSLLKENSDYVVKAIEQKITNWQNPTEKIFKVVQDIYEATQSTMAFVGQQNERSNKAKLTFPTVDLLTSHLTIQNLCILHKAILFETVWRQVGELRKNQVWIGALRQQEARFMPTAPENVESQLTQLLKEWNSIYPSLASKDRESTVTEITEFHHRFLSIHPFLDGNGRIARFVLSQQVAELLNVNKQIVLEDRAPYFDALSKADKGDRSDLKTVLIQAIYGTEKVPTDKLIRK